ncbi:MAG: DEAD/DEAH box helicase [Devosia sp.]
MMSLTFTTRPAPTGATIGLLEKSLFRQKTIAFDAWESADASEQAAIRHLRRLVEQGYAHPSGNDLAIDGAAVVNLPSRLAEILNVPPIASLTLGLSIEDRVESPKGLIRLAWQDKSARRTTPILTGPFVAIGDNLTGRLAAPIFALLEAVALYNHSLGLPGEARIEPWLGVQRALEKLTGQTVTTDRTLQSLRIYQAGAFALDVREAAGGPQITPVLMAHGMRQSLADDADAPETQNGEWFADTSASGLPDNESDALLVPELQRAFANSFVQQAGKTAPAIKISGNTYVVIEPELRAALDVVKAARQAPEAERRSFIANPRAFLDREIGTLGDVELGSVFVETHQYSARVLGLGRWEKPSLDWLTKQNTSWLPERFQLVIGSKTVELAHEDIEVFKSTVELAIQDHAETLNYKDDWLDTLLAIDALGTLKHFGEQQQQELQGDPDREATDPGDPVIKPDTDVLLINDNIDGTAFQAQIVARKASLPKSLPIHLLRANQPKLHQSAGFDWLLSAWVSGTPGVLLADDMGLGKTFQALSFMAWFRANQQAPGAKTQPFDGPIIIVAPTALLLNWEKEADLHLVAGSLGQCVKAFGKGLSELKSKKTDAGWTPEDALDVDVLRDADWILTTYETLATYHRAFARVSYSLGVFDEMQKVKAPDTLNTHALKALNVDFVVGMTGTPIENRLEDLWCIMDRIEPGYLGGLRDFSKTYNTNSSEPLQALKAKLDQPRPNVPAVMLRRMKQDILEGLPSKTPKSYPVAMPPEQADAYAKAVAAAKSGERTMGAMLTAIHALRGVSVHPGGGKGIDVYDPEARRRWIAQSARVRTTLEILGTIQRSGEKALVFIEDRAMQSTFATVAAAELNLPSEPEIINGELPGDRRQAVVDRFQDLPLGFALLLLSPKAAGIGLTITAANHVIHLSRWWNPAVEDQCNDRVYRIGQTRPVTIHIPIAKHPVLGDASFDVKLDALLERKRTLSRDMLAPPISDSDVSDLFGSAVQ